MSAGGDVTASEAVSVGARRELPAFRVSRSTRLHLVVLIVSVGIVVLLASVPIWAQERGWSLSCLRSMRER